MATYRSEYPLSLSNGTGLISQISAIESAPWNGLMEDVQSIERLYSIRSGFKSLTDSFLSLPVDARPNVIAAMYFQKWKRLFEDYVIEYNPLDAYTMTENYEKDSEGSSLGETRHGKSVSESGTDTGTVGTVGTDNNNSAGSVYGFNSVEAVPSEKGTEESTYNSTDTRNLSTSRTINNSGQDDHETATTDHEEFKSTKKGNIGYTTPQELLRQNIELWKIPFFDIVFSDIDSLITISVY